MADLSWVERFGLRPSDLPKCAGKHSGPVLIVAPGWTLWQDVAAAGKIDHLPVIAVKDAGIYWPGQVDHWYSSHLDQLFEMKRMRSCRSRYKNADTRSPRLHSIYEGERVTHWPWPGHSSSGLMAAYTAFGLGYDHAIVCGMPQDALGHFYDPPTGHLMAGHPHNFDKAKNEKLWKLAEQTIFRGRLRAMSGNLRRWISEAQGG